jgi:hypothetical protein
MIVCFMLNSCGVISERSVYEGVRSTQKAKSTGSTSDQKDLPPYDQYEKERNAIRK